MLKAYWGEMFGDFEVSKGKFEIAAFPEKLMSAHFDVSNIIGPAPAKAHKSFRICSYKPLEKKLERVEFEKVESELLKQAVIQNKFWDFQLENQPEAFEFIKRLLPFLGSRPKKHFHYKISIDGDLAASVVVGVAPSGVFLFNALVGKNQRKMGLGRILLDKVRSDFPDKGTFYWTVHGYLGGDADQVEEMHLI